MPWRGTQKKWHRRGCDAEAWTEQCYRCGGTGHRGGKKDDPRDCAWCNGFGFVCGSCGQAFQK